MKHMKNPIDNQINIGIQEPISFGVLYESPRCSLFKMSLIEDGICLPVSIRRLSLVEDLFLLMNVVCAVETLATVKICEINVK
ncbi:uncharacterized protein RHIMIDRAFT_239290 [Rhizopus microsporus ATCC 52813]|uniref:Uncharacterized protein n=1 Tax=Rhizopus microsporus ATCC 52813 TaxID=1340429 RepID=A0A2G4SQW6_RHIZD|nr:uncharacterized protein RHIMIDRAFT_239290 [Rhizopus microsporus ATCC 52813]PHZ11145.1 hypothetical protein RHIMIDRAFT_239290 [Rhizopus microsporus ATCC 52813]